MLLFFFWRNLLFARLSLSADFLFLGGRKKRGREETDSFVFAGHGEVGNKLTGQLLERPECDTRGQGNQKPLAAACSYLCSLVLMLWWWEWWG